MTIRCAMPSSSISASAEASWSRVVSRIERPQSSFGWQSRLEPLSRSPIGTLAFTPQRTRKRRQLVLLSRSLIDVTGFTSEFIQLDEISESDRETGDM